MFCPIFWKVVLWIKPEKTTSGQRQTHLPKPFFKQRLIRQIIMMMMTKMKTSCLQHDFLRGHQNSHLISFILSENENIILFHQIYISITGCRRTIQWFKAHKESPFLISKGFVATRIGIDLFSLGDIRSRRKTGNLFIQFPRPNTEI